MTMRERTIGSYEIRHELGQGGMGTVYEAEQHDPIHRRVALKIIRTGMDSDVVLARFERERQALAVMSHDAIAKLFDAGTTPEGQPWFAMELVHGAPIVEYCEERQLTIHARLRLMQKVALGVHHAHQKGLIHRDLKPANVLVQEDTSEPSDDSHAPKIIDFGIARATERTLTDHPLQTEEGQIIGTPEYMSPEQIEGQHTAIDVRTDVYALGVMLYELLTSQLPFSPEELRADGLVGLLRKIRDTDPPLPSTLVLPTAPISRSVAERRGTNAVDLHRKLKGELDWIVSKAMRKDPSARYDSAAAFADDLGRYLANRPVLARPATRLYHLKKLIRRNRAASLAVALFVGAMLAGLLGTSYGLRRSLAAERETSAQLARANAAEAETRRELARAESASRILTRMIRGVGPYVALGRDTELFEELLADLERMLASGRVADPLVGAEIRFILGWAYVDLGQNDRALDRFAAARPVLVAERGRFHEDVLSLDQQRAVALLARDERPAATEILTQTLAAWETHHGPSTRGALATRSTLIDLMASSDDLDARERLCRDQQEGLAGMPEELQEQNSDLSIGLWITMAVLRQAQNRFEEALELLDRAATLHNRSRPDDRVLGLNILSRRARLLRDLGRSGEAFELAKRALEMTTPLFGPDHEQTRVARETVLEQMRPTNTPEAEWRGLATEHLARSEESLEIDSLELASARYSLAMGAMTYRDIGLADRQVDACLSILEAREDASVSIRLAARNLQALVKMQMGALPDAAEAYEALIQAQRDALGPKDRQTLASICNHGWVLLRLGRTADAKKEFLRCKPAMVDVLGESHEFHRNTIRGLLECARATGDATGEQELTVELRRILEALAEGAPPDLEAMRDLAYDLCFHPRFDLRDLAAAAGWASKARSIDPTPHPPTLDVLARHAVSQSRYAEAVALIDEAMTAVPEGTASWQAFNRFRASCAEQASRK